MLHHFCSHAETSLIYFSVLWSTWEAAFLFICSFTNYHKKKLLFIAYRFLFLNWKCFRGSSFYFFIGYNEVKYWVWNICVHLGPSHLAVVPPEIFFNGTLFFSTCKQCALTQTLTMSSKILSVLIYSFNWRQIWIKRSACLKFFELLCIEMTDWLQWVNKWRCNTICYWGKIFKVT